MSAQTIDTVDLERYPIDDLDGPAGRDLVARCRAELAAVGACDLPGFLERRAIEQIVAEIPRRGVTPHRTETTHNIEFSGGEAELADDDPLRLQVRSAKSLIAYDRIPESSPLRAVYESDELTAFVGAALGVEPLFRQSDEIGARNVMLYDSGDELGWHFDNADFVVTLMLQAPLAGGAFEYVPTPRTADDRNPRGVAALLEGDRTGVRTMSPEPGTLALFRGTPSARTASRPSRGAPRASTPCSRTPTPPTPG